MTARILIPRYVEELGPFVEAGVLDVTDIHLANSFARVSGESSRSVLLAAALAARAPRLGHVCVDLATIAGTAVSTADSPIESDNSDSPPSSHRESRSSSGDDTDTARTRTVGIQTGGPQWDPVDLGALGWPDPDQWAEDLRNSDLVAVVETVGTPTGSEGPRPAGGSELKPLVLDRGRLYLSRYWYQERYVAADLVYRSRTDLVDLPEMGSGADPTTAAEKHIRRLFGQNPDRDQLDASLAGLERALVVISGGPGTGKTTTVARFLAGLISGMKDGGAQFQIALAAPTGKAAARMTESIRGAIDMLRSELSAPVVADLQEVEATTIHRLLGRQGPTGFLHGPGNPLSHDLVIVDEVSMVSLDLMAHLLAALRRDARVVLVGDPYQLASVEAGVVLGDMVGLSRQLSDPPTEKGSGETPGEGSQDPLPPEAIRTSVRTLRTVHRQASGSPILELAAAVRLGRVDRVVGLLNSGIDELRWVRTADTHRMVDPERGIEANGLAGVQEEVVTAAAEVVQAAVDGDIPLAIQCIGRTKVLCGQRVGPTGVSAWNKLVETSLRARGLVNWEHFYVGRPVMVTENDYLNKVFNGDVGVAVGGGGHSQVWFPGHDANRMIEAARLDRVATQWAMTIHKSQGSEFPHVIVSLPQSSSRVLTRELLYTAVTRAKSRLTIVSSEESIRASLERPVSRSTGLTDRLDRAGIDPQSLFVSPS